MNLVFFVDTPTKKEEKNPDLSLSVLHINIRSLKPHLDKLEALVLSLEKTPEIICLTETWLCESDNFAGLLINGYNQFCVKNRLSTVGGGVMIQVKSNCLLLRELKTQFEEAILAEFALNS